MHIAVPSLSSNETLLSSISKSSIVMRPRSRAKAIPTRPQFALVAESRLRKDGNGNEEKHKTVLKNRNKFHDTLRLALARSLALCKLWCSSLLYKHAAAQVSEKTKKRLKSCSIDRERSVPTQLLVEIF